VFVVVIVGFLNCLFNKLFVWSECPDGFYGQDCLDECSCENGDCHHVTGVCNCSAGYVGSSCSMSKSL